MPAVVVERPKRSEAMWDALKNHIIRERQRKKQEQEADAEVERQRKERERQQKQDVMTLGETREQISQLESRLAQLKEEKHQLFLQLKKVLHEDDNRRRQMVVKETNDLMNVPAYQPGAVALGSHPQIFLQSNMSIPGRTGHLYGNKVPSTHTQHTLLPPGALKRSHSPSPPPQNYHQTYSYKAPSAMPPYPQQKVDDGRRGGHEYVRAVLWNKPAHSSPYPTTQPTAFYPHPPVSQPHVVSTAVSYAPAPAQTIYTYAGPGHPQYAQPPPVASSSSREEPGKHVPSVYLTHSQQQARSIQQHTQGYVGSLHQQMEHSNQKSGFPTQDAEKYYQAQPHASAVGIRQTTHVPIHGGGIPIQQAPQGAKTGGITTGYPIRAQPSTHASTGTYQPSVSTPHVSSSVYPGQPTAAAPRVSYAQTTLHTATQQGHPQAQGRYSMP